MAGSNESQAKLAKSVVGFEHPAKGPHDCDECAHYLPKDRECGIVRGTIGPEDWCRRFKLSKRRLAEDSEKDAE